MSSDSYTDNGRQVRDFPELTFRCLQGEVDYSLILSIYLSSNDADHIHDPASLEDMKHWCAQSVRFDPSEDILFAVLDTEGGESSVVGFSRISWYTGLKDTRLYVQSSFLHPDWREYGCWPAIVQQNERRLREIATSHPFTAQRFYQAWATSAQVKWISTLESEGYKAVRHFNNMLHQLDNIPEQGVPEGLEVRPVQTEHYRSIWEAQREVQLELFEVVAENWTDDRYASWLANPSHTPQLWQVAWDGDQVVGMVLPRIDEEENRQLRRKRGYTEHVFIRRPWRKRGLAKALVVRSLRVLKEQGMQEAELGVDSENESGAFGFYHRLGYETFSTDIWFRKPMV
jgi:ribosomal protein S18 acetylase RimI-like enzyme